MSRLARVLTLCLILSTCRRPLNPVGVPQPASAQPTDCSDLQVARGLLPAYSTLFRLPAQDDDAGRPMLLLDHGVLEPGRRRGLLKSHSESYLQELAPTEIRRYLERPLPTRFSVLGLAGRSQLHTRAGRSFVVWGGSGMIYPHVVTELLVENAQLARPWHPANIVYGTPPDFVPAVPDTRCVAELRWHRGMNARLDDLEAGLPHRDLERSFPSLYRDLKSKRCKEPGCDGRLSVTAALLPDGSRVFDITVAHITPDPKDNDECTWDEDYSHGIFWQPGAGRMPQPLELLRQQAAGAMAMTTPSPTTS